MELNKVICADSFAHIKEIPDNTFDCCVTDPPGWLINDKGPLHWSYYFAWLDPILPEVKRVVKDNGFIAFFQNQMFFPHIFKFFGYETKIFICAKAEKDYLCEWQTKDSKSNFLMQYDPVVMWYNGQSGSNFKSKDYYVCQNSRPDQQRNTRPLDVVKYIMEEFSVGSVLDPFCGRGTTLVAAELLGRPYYGIDIDPKAVQDSKSRLSTCQITPT